MNERMWTLDIMFVMFFVPVPAYASGQKLVCIKKRDMRQGTRDHRDERDERDESDRDNGT